MKIRTMLAGAACLCAALSASATEWTYSASGSTYTITDGQWTLKVGKLAAADTTLKVTDISGWADPTSDPDKKGILDLRSQLTVKIDDATATITSVALNQSALCSTDIVEFYCDIIGAMGSSCFSGNSNMTKVEIGGTAEAMPSLLLNNCSNLKTAKFNFPNLRKVDASGWSVLGKSLTALDMIDVSTVAVPGVTNISASAFASSLWCGDLVLTNVMAIGDGAFNGAVLTNVTLAGSLAALSANVFKGSTITNVVLDLPSLSSVDSTAFTSQKKIRRVELVTAFSDMGLLTNIVAAADNTAINELVVYVSTNQWKASEAQTYSTSNTTGFFSALTDAEKAAAPAGAFGVLVVKGTRKGVFVDKASGSDSGDSESGGSESSDQSSTTWTYSATDKTITDGQWTFSVGDLTEVSTSITFAKGSLKSWVEPSDVSKKGVLDMRSPFIIKIGDGQATITSVVLDQYLLSPIGGNYKDSALAGVNNLSEFYCDNVSSIGLAFCKGATNLKNVYLTGTLTEMSNMVFGDTSLTNVVFDLPNLKSMNDQTFATGSETVQSVHLLSAFADMSMAYHIVRNAGGSDKDVDHVAQTGCRIYLSKRQWKKAARDAAKVAKTFTSEFTDAEKEKIANDSTLARVYGVVSDGEPEKLHHRRAFFVHEASPHDKIPAGTMLFFR